jgi:hypothetical protein
LAHRKALPYWFTKFFATEGNAMARPIDQWLRPEGDDAAYAELVALAARLRELILAQPLPDLLGYLYAQLLLGRLAQPGEAAAHVRATEKDARDQLIQLQFALEYVHAAWAGPVAPAEGPFNEVAMAPLLATADELRHKSLLAAMRWTRLNEDAAHDPSRAELLIRALHNWILLRGNRYQAMEDEFYRFALTPHDDALRERFGVGADAIAEGIQALSDKLRTGHAHAITVFGEAFSDVQMRAEQQSLGLDEATAQWQRDAPERMRPLQEAMEDLFKGGICHVNRHCALPRSVLEVLAYAPGEETDFWAPGAFSGSPLRTLPARKRPLIRLDDEFYSTDPSFVRDASYPILVHQLQQGTDAQRTAFRQRQQAMAEHAFTSILADQLQGAQVYRSVYYRIAGRNWRENDTVIVLDDTLIIVEAKAGAAATVASPATDFPRHVRAIEDLIVKAHAQCKGLLDRLDELGELPLCQYRDGRYQEVVRLKLAAFRRIIPIGLTVESMAPFSAACGRIPGIDPILGRYPFISVAIDELFILRRILPSTGALLHYLGTRQAAAGVPQLLLFDETDHLGAYLRYGSYPDALMRVRGADRAKLIAAGGMSDAIDACFMDPDNSGPPMADTELTELNQLLGALEATAAPGWTAINEVLRDVPAIARPPLATFLRISRRALPAEAHSWGWLRTAVPLVIWHTRSKNVDGDSQRQIAGAIAAFAQAPRAWLLTVHVDDQHVVHAVTGEQVIATAPEIPPTVPPPTVRRHEWRLPGLNLAPAGIMPRRNAPCWCGSGEKYKRCHGP